MEKTKLVQRPKTIENKTVDKIYWAKTKNKAILPTKRTEDAGYDIYACPSKKDYILEPGDIVLMPTGIASAFPEGYVGIVKERGSSGSKCMSVRMGVIDSGYRGEWFIGINNTSGHRIVITSDPIEWQKRHEFFNRTRVTVYPMSKAIAQVIFIKESGLKSSDSFISMDELEKMKSDRGAGALGSSNK